MPPDQLPKSHEEKPARSGNQRVVPMRKGAIKVFMGAIAIVAVLAICLMVLSRHI